jgi:putative tryptophan/tyrosine transport system substrate-binding protein
MKRTSLPLQRRQFITLLGGAAAWPVAARAQQPDRMRRVGVLMSTAADDAQGQAQVKAFQQGLEKLGWIEGRNLRLELRWGNGNTEQYRSYAAELIGLPCEVIATQSNQVTTIVSRLTRTVPIIFAGASNPLESGLIANMARPGGNITGFSQLEVAIVGKYIELLKEAAPALSRVAVLYTRGGPASAEFLRKIDALAPLFAIQTISIPADDSAEVDRAIDAFSREANAGLIILSGPGPANHREHLFSLVARHRLPAIYPYRFYAIDGGLMSYGPDIIEQYRRAASYVDLVLKGERPGNLPVQEPTKFELVINLKAAKSIGLDIPASLLARADEVIE